MASALTNDLGKEALKSILDCIPDDRQEAPAKLIVKAVVRGPEIGESLREHANSLIKGHPRASLLLAAKQLKIRLSNKIENVPLALAIIHKTKSHLPEECGICKDIYVVPLSESTTRRNNYCHVCGQGSHDCSQEVDVYRAMTDINNDYLESACLRWLCPSCNVSLHWLNNSTQNKFKVFCTGNKTYADAIKTTNVSIMNQTNHSNVTTPRSTNLSDIKILSNNSQRRNFSGFQDETFTVPVLHLGHPFSSNTNGNQTSTPSQPVVTTPTQPPTTTSSQPVVTTLAQPPANNTAISLNFKDVKKFPNMNKNKICSFLTMGKCRYGAKGENQFGKCDKYHPNQCRAYNLNGSSDNGCKNSIKCNEWHATYICRSSANSKTCSRSECPFKHHRNCTMTSNDNFLENNHHHMMPRQHMGPKFPRFNHHQQQHHSHKFPLVNHRQPFHHQQPFHQQQPFHHQKPFHHQQSPNQSPQVSPDHLLYMIRTMIREENNYQYHTI